MENQEQQHKRRVRYKGTHPRSYKEKYKELQPEKYADTIEKVIQKGGTPAGMHISICVQEILDFLQIQPGQTGLDATLGYGGHSSKMLSCLEGKGHLYALDVDPIEIKKTKARLEKMGYGEDILTIKQMNFADVEQLKEESGGFDFVLADLGVSSMQIDNPERGFTYKFEGPLDLRLNPEKGISAAERLKNISQPELEGMLIENSDEPYAKEILQYTDPYVCKAANIAPLQYVYDILSPYLYLGHEFGNRLRQKGIAIVHSDRASGMLGFEVTGYLLQQLVKSVREAKEYRKELGL